MSSGNLSTFVFQEAQVRTVLQDGEPWFVAGDVCRILDIKEAKDAVARLDEDERGRFEIATAGGIQETTCVSESGLYSLVLGSRKPEAKSFKRWVTHEVLPSIRKTGSWSAVDKLTRKDLALMLLESEEERERAQAQLEAAKPAIDFHAQVTASEDWLSMRKAAAVLNIKGLGQNNLFAFLRGQEVLMRNNIPQRRYIEQGYFRVQEFPSRYVNGQVFQQTMVSQKGLDFILRQWNRANTAAVAQA